MSKIHPITLAVREALEILGRKAAAADVRVKVLEQHPELATEANDPRFPLRVRQNRNKKCRSTDAAARPSAVTLTLLDKYDLADRFFCLCGSSHKHAQEALTLLEKVNLQQLHTGLNAWAKLVETAGGIEKARAVLEAMRQSGLC